MSNIHTLTTVLALYYLGSRGIPIQLGGIVEMRRDQYVLDPDGVKNTLLEPVLVTVSSDGGFTLSKARLVNPAGNNYRILDSPRIESLGCFRQILDQARASGMLKPEQVQVGMPMTDFQNSVTSVAIPGFVFDPQKRDVCRAFVMNHLDRIFHEDSSSAQFVRVHEAAIMATLEFMRACP
ncbi:MAG: hypothetical protein N2691_02880 [Patescibacteria group bacterium]|nr:hypothetical protein [Patescibacteria group bacterium]